jgi:catechol 2,3-dioxygenase-like lactoylglutathione lyase family enzyme
MKLKSVSGLVLYVKDIEKTAKFYEALGFNSDEHTDDKLTVRLNWFWLYFHAQDKEDNEEFKEEATIEPKGGGLYIYISVEDVDEFYQGAIDKGLKPSSEPRDWPWGNREFAMRDPDGFKLVFFKRN